jgi:hypothetical protein
VLANCLAALAVQRDEQINASKVLALATPRAWMIFRLLNQSSNSCQPDFVESK